LSSLSPSAASKANECDPDTETADVAEPPDTPEISKDNTDDKEQNFSLNLDPNVLPMAIPLPPLISPNSSWSSSRLKQHTTEAPGRCRAGVFIVKIYGGLSMCVLLTWSAFHQEFYFKLILQVIKTNMQLTKKLTRLLSKIASGENRRGFAPDVPILKDGLTRPYNFFSLDELTSMQNGNRGINDPDADTNFSLAINWAHDLFSERPEASKLVLRNHSGSIFCRKKFGKETYFQYSTEKFEDFEEIARHYLKTNHNINFV